MNRLTITGLILLLFFESYGQAKLPIPRNIQTTFNNGTRSESGAPGKNYWQNTADYVLNINFDPVSRTLTGFEDIHYVNNSPDSLDRIGFMLYANFYKKGGARSSPISAEDAGEGMQIEKILINGKGRDMNKVRIRGSYMNLRIDKIAPGKTMDFHINYTYILNKGSHMRTGEIEPGADFVAYFFPRIAVYDDIDGWNSFAYNGAQEFYNDFCHFKVNIMVPKDFVVWATGNLLNGDKVFTDTFYSRIKKAGETDGITSIIDSTDLKTGNITASNPFNTWQFEANDVTDFVFAVSDHYVWKSSSLIVDKKSGRRTRVDAVFNPDHKDYYSVIDYARATVQHMSYDFPKWPFPYPHETIFDGLDQMEYPMMVNDNPVEDKEEDIELTDHEIFHTMFPFYMGINETKYAWMDEGWATIGEWLISPMIDNTIIDRYGVGAYARAAGTEGDVPIITLSTQESGQAYFTNSYPKPAFGYLYAKDMLGDDLFYKGLHYYIEQWHGKHPMPLDFFNCMNTGSGKNLNWFWKRWFYDDGVPDLAITDVTHSGNDFRVQVTLKGTKPIPIDLTIFYNDNSTQQIHQSVAVWEKGETNFSISFTAKKPVSKLELGSAHIPDSNPEDNTYEMK